MTSKDPLRPHGETPLAGEPSPVAAGLTCRCPRCGKGPLFEQVLKLRPRCTSCDLDYAFIDTGDGPAIFAIFLLGFLVLGGALIAEFKFAIAWWTHVLLWGLLTPLLAVFVLRWLKATLIALQYRNTAEQARLGED